MHELRMLSVDLTGVAALRAASALVVEVVVDDVEAGVPSLDAAQVELLQADGAREVLDGEF